MTKILVDGVTRTYVIRVTGWQRNTCIYVAPLVGKNVLFFKSNTEHIPHMLHLVEHVRAIGEVVLKVR